MEREQIAVAAKLRDAAGLKRALPMRWEFNRLALGSLTLGFWCAGAIGALVPLEAGGSGFCPRKSSGRLQGKGSSNTAGTFSVLGLGGW